jgi:hypothetical protein
MDRIFRSTRCCVPLILVAVIVAGPLLTNALVAQPQPNPPPPLPVAEQNRDANGLIRVHEQGTANVNVTSGSLKVGGAVSVTNFPATQNVFVTGGTLDAASLTPVAQVHQYSAKLDPGDKKDFYFDTIPNMVFVRASATFGEGFIDFFTPLTVAPLFSVDLRESGGAREEVKSFAHPVPINGVRFYCLSDSTFFCSMDVTILTP